ncbi:DUF5000 domain-containing lipoprotein [Chitinophagaceae bacterium LB-8]|uniref:DUF5000 domain-containing lipoprotein n=1 Tax=Paraflavisolibacter caeni TaxID=2982496 RepID=A0A9X2XNW1_9BACT|nr:DUF5000 domain-containing lipoprotein [Paraflavisolibacter caeni]MCU7549793.1 DUF5000 domain-containing lipoprotein [Paraflavisolibacter caeni]
MKKLLVISYSLLFAALFTACTKGSNYNEVVSKDKTVPPAVSNVRVENLAGAAQLTYDLPKSDNILYVKADYFIRDGVKRQTTASYYGNKMLLDGFADAKEYEVTLTVVSRASVSSQPVTIKVNPGTPPYKLAYQKLLANQDFGGVYATMTNGTGSNVGLTILKYDSLYNVMKPVMQKFSKDSVMTLTVRGYNPVNYYWGFVVSDQFGNHTDTLFKWITPILETQMDKSLFKTFPLPTDPAENWPMRYLWDGNLTGDNPGSWRALGGSLSPVVCTFDMGVSARLSRFRLWGRGGAFAFTNENVKEFAMWGSNQPIPKDALLPVGATKGLVVGDWICLGRFQHPPKPSGLPVGQNSAEDNALYAAGFEFEFDKDIPPVRYMRLAAETIMQGGGNVIVRELTFHGQVIK